MSIFAFICPYQLLTLKKKVTFRQLFSRPGPYDPYGWNSPGRTSLLDECHQNVCTLGLLTRSVLIEIAWGFLRLVRNCHGEDDIKKYQ